MENWLHQMEMWQTVFPHEKKKKNPERMQKNVCFIVFL